jgi:hypothetical protein
VVVTDAHHEYHQTAAECDERTVEAETRRSSHEDHARDRPTRDRDRARAPKDDLGGVRCVNESDECGNHAEEGDADRGQSISR